MLMSRLAKRCDMGRLRSGSVLFKVFRVRMHRRELNKDFPGGGWSRGDSS